MKLTYQLNHDALKLENCAYIGMFHWFLQSSKDLFYTSWDRKLDTQFLYAQLDNVNCGENVFFGPFTKLDTNMNALNQSVSSTKSNKNCCKIKTMLSNFIYLILTSITITIDYLARQKVLHKVTY